MAPPSSQIKVSVIIPAYNVGSYIQECLDSALNQTLKEIEVILIDDASTDDSANIIGSAAESDPRIVFIQNERNMGVGATRNAGLKVVRGKYIKIIDSDDYMALDALSVLYEEAEAHQADIVFHDAFLYEEGKESAPYLYPERHKKLEGMCGHAAWWYLFKSDIVQNNQSITFPIGAHPHEDTAFSFMLFSFCHSARYAKKNLIYYRQHEQMVTRQIVGEKRQQNGASASICINQLCDFYYSQDKEIVVRRKKPFYDLLIFMGPEVDGNLRFRVKLILMGLKVRRFIYRSKITQSNHRFIKVLGIPVYRSKRPDNCGIRGVHQSD